MIAERLSARHLILFHYRIAFVCVYVCIYDMSVTDVGAVSISDCAYSLHARAEYLAPPTKSMSAPAIQKARRAAAKISM